ncbi:MAG TPA: helix-turn-helix transcriptional regulator [Solirubrobacterales bacterium]
MSTGDLPTLREALGAVVRAERARRGMALRPLASKAGVAPAYLGEVERGLKEPSSETLARLADALDLSIAELLRRAADVLVGAEPRQGRSDLMASLGQVVTDLGDDDLAALVRFGEFLASRRGS